MSIPKIYITTSLISTPAGHGKIARSAWGPEIFQHKCSDRRISLGVFALSVQCSVHACHFSAFKLALHLQSLNSRINKNMPCALFDRPKKAKKGKRSVSLFFFFKGVVKCTTITVVLERIPQCAPPTDKGRFRGNG